MADIDRFVKDENLKLYNLQSNMKFSERVRLSPKIAEIRFLLNLLKTADLTKDQKEDIKEDIEEATDKAGKDSQAEREREALAFAVTSRVKANQTEIPDIVRKKALMVKASTLFHDNNQNVDDVNDFMKNNDVDFTVDEELSTPEGLVIYENSNPDNVKIAYRGSKMNNIGDWTSNAKILVGQEETNYLNDDRFTETYDQINRVKAKYNTTPSEFVGTSRGANMAITAGDKFGVDTTTFNAFLGKNLIHSNESSAKHTLWRTTDDLPSIGLGFKNNTNNYDINSIHPLSKYTTPRGVHTLDNFIDTDSSRTGNLERLWEKMTAATKRHGEAFQIQDVANYKDGVAPKPPPTDLYNIGKKAKMASPSPLLAHDIEPELYNTETSRTRPEMYNPQADIDAAYDDLENPAVDDPFPLEDVEEDLFMKRFLQEALDVPDEDLQAQFESLDTSDFNPKSDIERDLMDDLLNTNRGSSLAEPAPPKPFVEYFRQTPEMELQTFQPVFRSEKQPAAKVSASSGSGRTKGKRDDDAQTRTLESLEEDGLVASPGAQGETQAPSRLFIEEDNEPPIPRTRELADDFVMTPSADAADAADAAAGDLTFTDYIKQFSPRDAPSGEPLSTRLHNNSRHVKIWKEVGGTFTPEEKARVDSLPTGDEDDPFNLTQQERQEIMNASPDERQDLIDGYDQAAQDSMQTFDEASSVDNGRGGKTLLSNDIAGGVNPLNIGVGLIAGGLASSSVNALINKIDPNMKQLPKQAIIGGSANLIGEGAVAGLSGASFGLAGAVPALAGGVAGGAAGYGAFVGVKKLGGDDFEATTAAGTAGGLATAFGSGLTAAAIGAAPLDPETLGLASLGAGLLGGTIGAASYVGTEEQKALKTKFTSQGLTPLESDLAADSLTGATMGAAGGTLFGPVGTIAGGLIGAGVGSLVALGGFAAGKIF